MKKFVLALLAALLVLGCTVALAANPGDAPCHEYGNTCVAGEWTTTKYATCTATGEENQLCTVCGDVMDHRTIAKLPHAYGEWVVIDEPSCVDEDYGMKKRTCEDCGAVDTAVVVTATDLHKWDNGTVLSTPTCQEQGETLYICTVDGCSARKKTYQAKIACDSKVEAIVPSTCTVKGTKTTTCSMCGGNKKTTELAYANHVLDHYQVKVAETCTTDGMNVAVCINCLNRFDGDIANEAGKGAALTKAQRDSLKRAALGHNYEGKVEKKVTCKDEGKEVYTCTRCGDTYTKTIPPKAEYHKWVESIVKEATETEKGMKHFSCTVCDEWYDEVYTYVAPVVPETPAEDETPADPDAPAEDEKEEDKPAADDKNDENDSEGTGSETGNGSDASIPATGDNGNTMAYIMMVVAAAGLVVLAASKRKVNC